MTATSVSPHRYRHEESENHCNRGVECLLLAEEENYQNKELLTEAADAFMEAISHHRQNTEAYVGMAYLLWVLQDKPLALQYLEQGLRTQPSHPDIHRMIKEITGQSFVVAVSTPSSGSSTPSSSSSPSIASPPKTAPVAPGAPDPEAQLQQQIKARVTELKAAVEAENTRLIKPTINMHEIEHLQERLRDWEHVYGHVLGQIDGLSQFHARVLLTCELSGLQDRILDYHSALKCSEELLALDDKIQATQQEIKTTQKDYENGKPGMYSALLDSFYDRCDAIADALDELENKNIPVRVLDSHYQQLVDRVEAFAVEVGDTDA